MLYFEASYFKSDTPFNAVVLLTRTDIIILISFVNLIFSSKKHINETISLTSWSYLTGGAGRHCSLFRLLPQCKICYWAFKLRFSESGWDEGSIRH